MELVGATMTTKKRKKLKVKNLIILLAILIVAILGISNVFNKPKEKEVVIEEAPIENEDNEEEILEEDNKVSFFFAGDAILHESVYVDAQNEDGTFNFDKQLHYIKDIVRKYDLAYYNQETILGGSDLGLSGYPTFNSPFEFGDYMVEAGFNLVSTANNHCLDRGTEGIINSHDFWKSKSGVLMQGTNISQEESDEIKSVEVKGIKFAFLSYTYGTNGISPEQAYQVNYYPNNDEEIIEKIKKAKSGDYRFEVRMPRYREKGGMFNLVLSTNAINIKNGFLSVPMSREFSKLHGGKRIRIPFPLRLEGKTIKEVRICPIYNGRYFKIQYCFLQEVEPQKVAPNNVLYSIALKFSNQGIVF